MCAFFHCMNVCLYLLVCFSCFRYSVVMDYRNMYPWAPENLLEETSVYTSSEKIVLYMKSERPKKCILGRENDRGLRVVPCREDELVCCDDSSDPNGPFCYFYTIVFKKVPLRLPLYNFEKELLTEINVAPAQLHPNSWAFVKGFSILCTHFGHLPSVEVFLYFFEAKHLGRQLWFSFNGVAGRALLSLFQQSYKGFKSNSLKNRCNKRDPTLLYGFPLYWTQKPNFQGGHATAGCLFFCSLKVVFDTVTLIKQEFSPGELKAYIGILCSLTLTDVNLCICLLNYLCFSCRQYVG